MGSSVSIVIPAYNEEARIGASLGDIHSYLSKNHSRFEIIVVDDASSDGTYGVLANFMKDKKNVRLIKNAVNRGKGYSVKKGILASSGEIVAFSDADQSVPIKELSKLIRVIEEGSDIAIASRALRDSAILKRQAMWRQTIGKVFGILVGLIVFGGIRDTQCGFKCFKREAAMDLFRRQRIDRFAFDVEILYLARLRGYSIQQIPAVWINSPKSTVKPFWDSIIMLRDLLVIKHLHKGET